MQEIVYKVHGAGKNHGPMGKKYDWKAVNSEDEFNEALEGGWFNTLVEAMEGKPRKRARNTDGEYIGDDPSTPDINEAYVDDSMPTRKEMEAKAKELNISYKRKTSDNDLLELIEAKIRG